MNQKRKIKQHYNTRQKKFKQVDDLLENISKVLDLMKINGDISEDDHKNLTVINKNLNETFDTIKNVTAVNHNPCLPDSLSSCELCQPHYVNVNTQCVAYCDTKNGQCKRNYSKKIPNLATCLAHFPFHGISLDILFLEDGKFTERIDTKISIVDIDIDEKKMSAWTESDSTKLSYTYRENEPEFLILHWDNIVTYLPISISFTVTGNNKER